MPARPVWQSENFLSGGWFHTRVSKTRSFAVAKNMLEPEIGANPIGENDRFVGRITDRDITIRAVGSGNDLSELMARHVTTARNRLLPRQSHWNRIATSRVV